ncbi:hypothetical protein K466DRAFT_503588 [Polyporus arcularius HHB13444]|uniref:Uncharacterized protein n=1 Tax=Polyporus arcularius HHB13444 TaxID=1314778 RepID=A0A5C3NX72_9APHY|nr:hypothetical protein K466DRAFT_503588 [Polyporus arcularius HHB13444]
MSTTRRSRRFATGDVLANIICTLEVLQATSNVAINVPFLNVICGSVLGLARAVEASGDKERFVRLARRAAELSLHIEESVESDPHAIGEALQSSLTQLHGLLSRIRSDVEKELRRTSLDRFFHRASIATILDNHIDALDSAWRAFDTACLIALRTKMERQATYDDRSQGSGTAVPWLCERSDSQSQTRYVVSIPCLLPLTDLQADQADYNTLVTYYPNVYVLPWRDLGPLIHLEPRHHPYVAQVLGYSHPSLSERFYVMDTGMGTVSDFPTPALTACRSDASHASVSRQGHVEPSNPLVATCKCSCCISQLMSETDHQIDR